MLSVSKVQLVTDLRAVKVEPEAAFIARLPLVCVKHHRLIHNVHVQTTRKTAKLLARRAPGIVTAPVKWRHATVFSRIQGKNSFQRQKQTAVTRWQRCKEWKQIGKKLYKRMGNITFTF